MKKYNCRVCRHKLEGMSHYGMCKECNYIYTVILKTNSSIVKNESIEKLLARLKADYATWKQNTKNNLSS